ncbi:Uncharacterized iron-regulated membrane protein [Paraoerskovia marina]|uniref:Uncharacterized iron-regulated membrane protein n=1 Tax=Paraoerskovia marina TaxID=545619 RepID=A0A1H1MFD6_9CELL|nr:PepSY domain-containing protein [Paraoerskovia marina]SDR85416.1 Uncharacterized iron-regulated membrane protein [Paraoerskovia marina]
MTTTTSTTPAAPPGDGTAPTPPPSTPRPRRPRSAIWAALRPILVRLHFYAGILVGPFLVVAATTGLLYTLAPAIEQVQHRDLLVVDEVGTTTVPLSEQVASARSTDPDGTVSTVQVSGDPDGTTRVVLAQEGLPEGAATTVFVDPYTGEVLGESLTYGLWLPEREWIETLHSSLHLGTVGLYYSELAASWLGIVVLGGVAMWIAKAVRARKARRLIVPETSKKGLRRTLSWHGVVGLVAAAGLIVLSITGLTWSESSGAQIGDLRAAVSPVAPELDTTLGEGSAGGGEHDHDAGPATGLTDADLAHGASWDGMTAAATAEGLDAPYKVSPPPADGQAWTVAEASTRWPAANDSIAVDGHSGAVVDRVDFSEKPFLTKLTGWGVHFHLGNLFGVANLVFLALTATALLSLIVLGYVMWWQRRPRRSTSARPGPAPSRGGLRAAPLWITGLLFAGAVVSAWYVPLFGITLAAFLVIDVLLGLLERRRHRAADRARAEDPETVG